MAAAYHASTLIGPYHGYRRPLDALARGLERAMEMENRPLELPKPQQATFQQIRPSSSLPGGLVEDGEYQLGLSSQQIPAIRPASLVDGLVELPAVSSAREGRIDPTFRRLAEAVRYFMRPPREIILEDREDVSELSRLSSETKLGNPRSRSASVE